MRPGDSLPVFSVNTLEEAEDLKLLCCRRTYPPDSRYVINVESGFNGDVKSLDDVATYLEERYERVLRNRN